MATRAAYLLFKTLEGGQEVEDTMRKLSEDIAKEEEAGRAKDAAVRRRSLAEANARAEQEQETPKMEQAETKALAPMASHPGAQLADPSSTE